MDEDYITGVYNRTNPFLNYLSNKQNTFGEQMKLTTPEIRKILIDFHARNNIV